MTDKIIMLTLFILGFCLFFLSAIYFTAYHVLNKCPKKTGRVKAELKHTKLKKDVMTKMSVYETDPEAGVIRNLTKVTFQYTVGEKTYKVRDDFIGRPRRVPRRVSVVYWKRFPRFSYVDKLYSLSDFRYFFRAGFMLLWALFFIAMGVFVLLN